MGDGEAPFVRRVVGAFGVAMGGQRGWQEGERDAQAVAVEELDGGVGETGGRGDVVGLEEDRRGRHGGVAEAGAGVL